MNSKLSQQTFDELVERTGNVVDFFNSKLGEQRLLEKQKTETKKKIKSLDQSIETIRFAKLALTEAASRTQSNVQAYVESLVTMVLQAVFRERFYKFIMELEIKRDQPECRLLVQEDEWPPFIPKDEQGGGMLDVLSFALRVVLWSLLPERSRAIFYLDEPMKFVGNGESPEVQRTLEMMKELSTRLGFQLIINTHEALVTIADRIFDVEHLEGRSRVTVNGKMQKATRVSLTRGR